MLFHRLLKTEAGYTMIEVMVSIIILAIALIPMVAMFDMGIQSAAKSSQYEKARALANLKMEEAKSVSYDSVRNNFPLGGNGTPYDEPAIWSYGPGGQGGNFGSIQYRVVKDFMTAPAQDQTDPFTFDISDEATGLIRVTVIVRWGDGNEYRTYGLVGQGQ